jgi:drug/metabolite transporter (DMT)-like permease
MHAVHLGGSHYTQYLGMSAGITAVLLSAQPLLTALIAARWFHEKLFTRQWIGIATGLAGVALVVLHEIDVREASVASLTAVTIALAGVTAGTLFRDASVRWWICVRVHSCNSLPRSWFCCRSQGLSRMRRYAGRGRLRARSSFS